MICMKNIRFSSLLWAKVRCQGPLSSARAQPWALHVMMEIYQLRVLVGFVDLFVRTPLQSIIFIETETKIQESILSLYMYICHVTEMKLFFVKTVFRGFEFQSYKLKVNILAFLIVLIRWNMLLSPTFFFITVAPEVTIDGGEQQFVVVGSEIQLTCHYNTSPPVSEVSWEKDGIVISRNGSVVVGVRRNITHFNDSTVQLTLVQSILSDSGNYNCVVTNRIDNLSATALVIIQG